MGFTKWGTVIFSDLVSKGRLARPGWQGQVGKARLARPGWQGRIIKARSDQTGRIGKIGQRKQRIRWLKYQVSKRIKYQVSKPKTHYKWRE